MGYCPAFNSVSARLSDNNAGISLVGTMSWKLPLKPDVYKRQIYGGALTLDVEFYVADRIALLANLRERCLWGGDTRKFHTQFGAGIKIIIN